MKIVGIVFLALAALSFVAAISAACYGAPDAAGRQIGLTLMLGVIGAAFYCDGKKKEKRNKNK